MNAALSPNALEQPTAARYVELATVANESAGRVLRLDTQDASALESKISIGLSLQAAELAGKGILRALGMSPSDIRTVHRRHNLMVLLESVEVRVEEHENRAVRLYGRFLDWRPIINDQEYACTVREYFEEHFQRGPSAFPRNYFYPDYETFAGPNPIQAIYVMVGHIIGCSSQIMEANPSCR